MHDHIYRYLMEDRNQELESINRNAWKYQKNDESYQYFSTRRLLGPLFKKRNHVKKAYNKGH